MVIIFLYFNTNKVIWQDILGGELTKLLINYIFKIGFVFVHNPEELKCLPCYLKYITG